MSLSLIQSLTNIQTVFAFLIYCLSLMIALPIFGKIHSRLEHYFLQMMWDKVGMPVLRTMLLIVFIVLAYPLNFGIAEAASLSQIMFADQTRFDFLFNMLFLITFIYPLIPVIGKADVLMIPLQGIVASIILFRWLAQHTGLSDYSLLPELNILIVIIIVAIVSYWIAKYLAEIIGTYLDVTFEREGYRILVFQAVIMLMQSPVIFIYGHSLARQIGAS